MKSRARLKGTLVVTALLGLAGGAVSVGYFAGRARAAGIPTTQPLSYSGVLTDANGTPLTGSKNIQIMLFDAPTGGSATCATTSAPQTLVAGAFQVTMPDSCVTAVRANPDVWVDVVVDGGSLGRTKLAAVPYAITSGEASCGLGVTGMIDTGAGFCIDATDRTETAYGSSIATCATEGKILCSFIQLCTARLRSAGGMRSDAAYRVSDLMYYSADGAHYLGGGGNNALAAPAACSTLVGPGPSGGGDIFRCCRGKG
jgi:hypothetical protein